MTDDETYRAPTARRPLQRSRADRVLGGVCGGMARHLDLDAPLLRIGAVVLAVVSGGPRSSSTSPRGCSFRVPSVSRRADRAVSPATAEPGTRGRPRAESCDR